MKNVFFSTPKQNANNHQDFCLRRPDFIFCSYWLPRSLFWPERGLRGMCIYLYSECGETAVSPTLPNLQKSTLGNY
jgi:hypothetical protein